MSNLISIRNGFATNSSSVHNIYVQRAEWHKWPKQKIISHYEKHVQTSQAEFNRDIEYRNDLCSIMNYGFVVTFPEHYNKKDVQKLTKDNDYSKCFQLFIRAYLENFTYLTFGMGYVDHGTEHLLSSKVVSDKDKEKYFWNFVRQVAGIEGRDDNYPISEDFMKKHNETLLHPR